MLVFYTHTNKIWLTASRISPNPHHSAILSKSVLTGVKRNTQLSPSRAPETHDQNLRGIGFYTTALTVALTPSVWQKDGVCFCPVSLSSPSTHPKTSTLWQNKANET